jgi:hypothetical protein
MWSFDLRFQRPAAQNEMEFGCIVGSHYSLEMHTSVTVQLP